ncbi:hypothetical protein [Mesorhizobium sp. M4B.F.Ca.ET.089.01.1.1]|nr:hypothetical protein [Mesorhizobium sp. M4B.F.Ca.ET.089.01.1.1]
MARRQCGARRKSGKKVVISDMGIKAPDRIISAFDWTLSGDIG